MTTLLVTPLARTHEGRVGLIEQVRQFAADAPAGPAPAAVQAAGPK